MESACKCKMLAVLLLLIIQCVAAIEWKHSAVLDNNFLVLWTPGENDVTFEVQVKTPGYVGFGFTRDQDSTEGVDMVIGWVDNNGQVHLQPKTTQTDAFRRNYPASALGSPNAFLNSRVLLRQMPE
ncbi:hypothetical protein TKK_0014804 [Trichogramma kaykai]